MVESDDRGRLRLLCAGTGRDGTVSLTEMIRELFEREGKGRQVAHEYESREFFAAFVRSMEETSQGGVDQARRLIAQCPYDVIVGNGYAPWLPLFAAHYGPRLTLVHLRRRDRTACVRSLVDNASFFPAAYGYYAQSPDAVVKRATAFHYGEMTRAEWEALSLFQKLAWYYDKTHALLFEYAGLFTTCHEINTEELNSESTLKLIGALATGAPVCASPKHLNVHAQLAALRPERHYKMQWLIGRFDIRHAADDDLYPLDYFANAFVGWTGYQIRRSEHIGPEDYRSEPQLIATLDRAAELLDRTRHLVELLRLDLAAASAADAEPL